MNKVILDCDPGMDDSMAIVMAAKSKALDLLGVTTCHGNYALPTTTANALKVLEMLNADSVPVCSGASHPLTRKSPSDPFTHGADGQAENNLPAPSMTTRAQHAAQFIIEKAHEFPHEVSLVITGPMTNFAIALALDTELPSLLKEVIAISGAFGLNEYSFLHATGDTPQSEWNVYVDPEAAKIVYGSGVPLKAIGLDVATHFSVDFTPEQLELLSRSSLREAQFLKKAISFVESRGYDSYCTVIDCLAIAYTIDPSILAFERALVGVETKSDLCRGMTVRDGRKHHYWSNLPAIEIATKANYEAFLQLVITLATL